MFLSLYVQLRRGFRIVTEAFPSLSWGPGPVVAAKKTGIFKKNSLFRNLAFLGPSQKPRP